MPRTRAYKNVPCRERNIPPILLVAPEEERCEIDEPIVAQKNETWTHSDGCSRRKSVHELEEDVEPRANDDDGRDRWGRRLSLDKIFH